MVDVQLAELEGSTEPGKIFPRLSTRAFLERRGNAVPRPDRAWARHNRCIMHVA